MMTSSDSMLTIGTQRIFRQSGGPTNPTAHRSVAIELGRIPSQSEVFLRTHTRKKDRGQFVNERSEQQIEQHKAEIKRLEDERAAHIVMLGFRNP
ncbi:hypothetical protein PIB30_064189 [Stylosanthes scabra]|uniref:Uncharacterized protein n=1 Tax=Stylosanthes scabra TaxID=79078 RepID=A0ABU6WSL8_9FABA|nr:hypothetical protein [Stylosanthes scabra]